MCLEMGAIETLIIWENFDVERFELMGPGGKMDYKHLTPEQVRVVWFSSKWADRCDVWHV